MRIPIIYFEIYKTNISIRKLGNGTYLYKTTELYIRSLFR